MSKRYPDTITYWDLKSYDYRELDTISSRILLFYIQSNGATSKNRLKEIVAGAKFSGFKNISIVKSRGEWMFKIPVSDKGFRKFIQEIRTIHRGKYETEQAQIANILLKYKRLNKPWWKFWSET